MISNSRVITVRGSGNVLIPPDWIIIDLDLVAAEYKYDDTLNAASKQLSQLRESLYFVDFEKEDIKTKRFNVNTVYSSYKDKNDNYRRVFEGYKASHDLFIAFDLDTARLGEILNAITESEANPEFSIDYTIKDKAAVKNQLLKNAVEDARIKAEILVEAAGVQLGKVLRVDYDWSEVRFRHDYNVSYEDSMMLSESLDFTPDEVKAYDNVTVVWSLE
ncbi:SIMPL domain-containing protein [Halanaerobiaceae bacterium Z-7014]|uniref:SIMPL domain-containing protein n=1 Tax=Halonatronomonas betaini TaxID=2778430 RepID=A0A931ATH0_9FIRM|nr:SIMPL domain-containing protein [Halonatronomonas betaini]MBF8436329.1 SIMPL domain-containing protein [Halonatronomonas betaini]